MNCGGRAATMFIIALFTSMSPLPGGAQFLRQDSEDSEGFSRIVIDGNPYGYFSESSKWQTSDIPVCWESTAMIAKYSDDRKIVQRTLANTWERHSIVKFVGWAACPSKVVGIRIGLADMRPKTVELGRRLSGVKNGMILNFDFADAYTNCNSMRRACIEAIAAHEFGHALGFDHEHNRRDRDDSCNKPRTSETDARPLTPYDPESVMNYCNADYWKGRLSSLDIVSIQVAYGRR